LSQFYADKKNKLLRNKYIMFLYYFEFILPGGYFVRALIYIGRYTSRLHILNVDPGTGLQNGPENFRQNFPENLGQNFPVPFPQNLPENFPVPFLQNLPENFPEPIPQNFPENFPQNDLAGQNGAGDILQNEPEMIPQNYPGNEAQNEPVILQNGKN